MVKYTDAYKEAQRAGAKPLFLLFIGTNMGLRCLGKETPNVNHVGDESFEWSARVLQFGDLRQSVSSDSDSVIQGLFEEEIGTYTATLDNADNYFSRIAGRETFLNGYVELMQGFDVPGFLHTDFLSLFSGQIVDFETSKMTFQFTAKQAVKADAPEDPSVDTSKIYTISNGGSGFTAASEVVPYADMEPVFYSGTSWISSQDITVETLTDPSILFAIDNSGESRVAIGVDENGFLYLGYTEDVSVTSPVEKTLTSSVLLSEGEDYHITVGWDGENGTVTFKDGKGQSDIVDIESTKTAAFDNSLGGYGTGDGQFINPGGIAIEAGDTVYIVDEGNQRIQKFFNDGAYFSQFPVTYSAAPTMTPKDIALDGYGFAYISCGVLLKYSTGGTLVSEIGSLGSGDGEFTRIRGVCLDSSGYIYTTDSLNPRVQKFASDGTYIGQFGSSGTGEGQFNTPTGIAIDSLGFIYVADTFNNRVQKFTSGFAFVSEWSVSNPRGIDIDPSNNVYVSVDDIVNERVGVFTSEGVLIYEFGSPGTGSGEFLLPFGIAIKHSGNIIVSDPERDDVQEFSPIEIFDTIDFSDTGSDDTLTISDDFDGDTTTSGFIVAGEPTFLLVNKEQPTSTEFTDIIGGLDIGVIDGTWTETWTIDEYISEIVPEDQADATEEIILPDTSIYPGSGPNQQNVILPLPYGDLSENSDQGVWVAPLINQDDHVYCAAGWSVLSVANGNAVSVFVAGEQVTTGWTFDESNDYQSQGEIATLTFASDPGGVVTVFCKGKAPGGTLLTNPIDIVSDFVDYAAGLVGNSAWQKDLSSFAKATSEADLAGYVGAGVIQANNTLGYWIKAMLKPFLGSFRFSETGLLQVSLQPTTETSNVFETVEESEAITVKAKQIIDNICGKILVNYAISYATIDRRFKNNSTTSYFRTAYATQQALNPQTWELDFDWCRRTVNIETVQNILLALYADPEYIVDYQGQDFKFVPLNMLDQLSTTLSFLVDVNGNPVEDVVCSLRHKTINMDTFTTTMSMQTLNFIDITPVEDNQLQFGGVDVQFGGIDVNFGGE